MKISCFSAVTILIGTIIGAGYASGQEIITFFLRYGQAGLWGLAATGILWILSFNVLFTVLRKDRIQSYSQLADLLFGHRIGILYQILVAFFMFISLAVMLSGTGTLLKEQWDLPYIYGVLLMAIAVLLTLYRSHTGLSFMNRLLVPLLVIGIFTASFTILSDRYIPSSMLSLEPIHTLRFSDSRVLQVLLRTLLYVSYNLISVVVIFSSVTVLHPHRTSIITGLILSLLSLSLGVATFINYGTIIEIEIPVPALLSAHPMMKETYILLLLAAMYTTAIGNAYGCLEAIGKRGIYWLSLILLGAMAASQWGFSTLIDKGYTFFGYIGLLQLLMLCLRARHRRYGG